MLMTEPTPELDPRFSSPGAPATPWGDTVAVLEAAEMFWLSTIRRNGRPHVVPLPAMWLDDALHFCTGPDEQKVRNLAASNRCVLTTGDRSFSSGLDVVVEGSARRVTERTLLQRLAAMWKRKLDWPFEATDEGFRETSGEVAGTDFAGAGVAHVFEVAPTKILAFARGEQFSQTRYRFT